jgi:Right handed beta helix region
MRSAIRLALAAVLLTFAFGGHTVFAVDAGGVWAQKAGMTKAKIFPGTCYGIEQAWAYAGRGGLVNVGAGRYAYPRTLRIATPGVTIEGAGDSTVFVAEAAPGDTAISVHADDVTLRDFAILGGGTGFTADAGIAVYSGKRFRADHVTVRRAALTAITVMSGCDEARITDCRIDSSGTDQTYPANGIAFLGVTHGIVSGCQVSYSTRADIYARTCRDTRIDGNIVWGRRAPAEPPNTAPDGGTEWACGIETDTTSTNVDVTGNSISDRMDGIQPRADSSLVANNKVFNCSNGIHNHGGGSGSTWQGNYVQGVSGYGLYIEIVYGACWGFTVRGNTVIDPGYNCMHVESQINTNGDLTIVGNHLIGGHQSALGSVRVIGVNGGKWYRVKVLDNIISGNAGSGVTLAGTGATGSIMDAVVRGNVIEDCARYGVELKTVGAASNVFLSDNLSRNNALGEALTNVALWTVSATAKDRRLVSSLSVADSLGLPPVAFSALGAQTNGTMLFCPDCTSPSSPCTGGGTGAAAIRQNGTWKCY